MKRCPTCNQEFTDEWLTFCTQDGAVLVESGRAEPEPTLYRAPMPPSVSPSEQPTLDLPGSHHAPLAPFAQPQPLEGSWTPPPPPAYTATGPPQGLAIASLIVGISSVTLGWCCSSGLLMAPTAIILGIASLVQNKNNPDKSAGKPLAIGGIVAGALYFVILGLILLVYGAAVILNGIH
jgi:Domain of unknown function (DUF4190)